MNKKIAIVHPNPNAYSETFIRNHIEYLPCEIIELNGGYLPTRIGTGDKGIPIISNFKNSIFRLHKKIFKKNSYNPYYKAIKNILKKEKIQAVLAEFGPTGVEMLPICEDLGLPLIVYFLGFDAHHRPTIKANNNYKQLFEKAAAIVGVSNKICEQLEQLGCPKEKIHYIVCGVTDLFFQENIPTDTAPNLVAVGRFTAKKAHYLTIMAFAQVLKVIPNAKLKIIGTGTELLDVCWQLIQMYNIQDSVELLGVLPPSKIAEIWKSARAFVQHSLESMDGDCEGTPVAVLEAGAIGLPVISTYHAGIADVVIHERTGLLSAERDVEAMAQNMVRILQDGEYAQKLGAQAKIHIKENYHIDISIKKLWELIKNIAK